MTEQNLVEGNEGMLDTREKIDPSIFGETGGINEVVTGANHARDKNFIVLFTKGYSSAWNEFIGKKGIKRR
jgi:hypothetical protein